MTVAQGKGWSDRSLGPGWKSVPWKFASRLCGFKHACIANKGLLRALPLMLIAAFFTSGAYAAEKTQVDKIPTHTTLFERQPLGFDLETVHSAIARIRTFPLQISVIEQFVRQQRAHLETRVRLLILLLAIAITSGLVARAFIARRVRTTLIRLYDATSTQSQAWFQTAVEIAAATMLPGVLWLCWWLVREVTLFEGPVFLVTGQLLAAWFFYSFGMTGVRELVGRPLVSISEEDGRYILRVSRLLLIYGIAGMVCVHLLSVFGAASDVLALVDKSLVFLLIALLAVATVRRRAVMSLLPRSENFLYQGFLIGVQRFYFLIWAFTVATALFQLAGFRTLATILWTRTWLPAGIFVLAIRLNDVLQKELHQALLGDAGQHENAINLYRSLSRLTRYAIAMLAIGGFTHLIGATGPVYRLLGQPVVTLGNQNVSIMVLGKALVIVVLFALAARLVRDYCEFRVYPHLNIDPGVANAINTFIVYVMVAIGVLAAVEAVGLGLGTIALFAGALGIGVGMGLQSTANNLTGGLTLIFTRALRKGDVVTTGETMGVIQEVGIRATRLKTPDAIEFLVPNSEFVDGKLVNWTRSDPYTRVHVPIGVSYDADPEIVRRTMFEVGVSTPNVQPEPAPEVRFASLGDSSLNFELLIWINVKDVQPERVRSDLYFGLFRAFKNAKIEIPFPQRDIRIRSDGIPPELKAERGKSAAPQL